MDSGPADICQLEEEIFMHENAIESFNRKLQLIQQQISEEKRRLAAHTTRETELNEQCNALRNNLEEQTR